MAAYTKYFGNENPLEILGVETTASVEDIRSAYLEKIRLYPPERNPEQFEKIRDAYDLLNNPRQRARIVVAADPKQPLTELIKDKNGSLHFTGPQLWLNVMKPKTI